MIQTTEMAAVKDTAGEPNGDDKALGKEAFAESPKVFVKSLPVRKNILVYFFLNSHTLKHQHPPERN